MRANGLQFFSGAADQAMKGTLTKLKPKRRWLQVSLRTMLLLVTLLCVALATWVVPLERRRRAVEAIKALGGTVIFVSETRNESFPMGLLLQRLPDAYVEEVGYVLLSDTEITDSGLANVQGLTGLLGLSLDNTQVTDAGLAHLQGLTALRELSINNARVTDSGLAHLHGLTGLQQLWLYNTHVTDAGLDLK